MKNALTLFINQTIQELRKVVWPNKRQVIQHTLIVIVFSLAVAAFLGALDIIFSFGIEKLLLSSS